MDCWRWVATSRSNACSRPTAGHLPLVRRPQPDPVVEHRTRARCCSPRCRQPVSRSLKPSPAHEPLHGHHDRGFHRVIVRLRGPAMRGTRHLDHRFHGAGSTWNCTIAGIAHSIEVWTNSSSCRAGSTVWPSGRCFFGESMFSRAQRRIEGRAGGPEPGCSATARAGYHRLPGGKRPPELRWGNKHTGDWTLRTTLPTLAPGTRGVTGLLERCARLTGEHCCDVADRPLRNLKVYTTTHTAAATSRAGSHHAVRGPAHTHRQATLYSQLSLLGFRRSGSHLYRPNCGTATPASRRGSRKALQPIAPATQLEAQRGPDMVSNSKTSTPTSPSSSTAATSRPGMPTATCTRPRGTSTSRSSAPNGV